MIVGGNLNIVDVIVILIILMSGIVGFKRGVFKELVMTIGFLLVFVISFKLKNPLAEWLSLHLPFFNFGNVFDNVSIINIIFYQVVSFMIIFSLLMIIFRIVLAVTSFFEKILKFTIILGIPSKILGFFVGLIEGYILGFIIMFILAQPMFGDISASSKLKDPMLNSTPILASVVSEMNDTVIDIYNLKDSVSDSKKLERGITKIMLERNLVDSDYIDKLIEANKIKIDDAASLLDAYR